MGCFISAMILAIIFYSMKEGQSINDDIFVFYFSIIFLSVYFVICFYLIIASIPKIKRYKKNTKKKLEWR